MEITQEDLDKQLADAATKAKEEAVSETSSAKEAEYQTKMDDLKKEMDAKIEKTNQEAQKKVSEHGDELGRLRKVKEDAETKAKEFDSVRSELDGYKTKEKETDEAKRKAEEAANANPADKLKSLEMSDEEATKLDELVKNGDDDLKAKFSNPETATQALVDALEVLRESKPSEDAGSPAAAWRKKEKESAVDDPTSVREVIKQQLKITDQQANKVADGLGGGTFTGSPGRDETKTPSQTYAGFRESTEKKK